MECCRKFKTIINAKGNNIAANQAENNNNNNNNANEFIN